MTLRLALSQLWWMIVYSTPSFGAEGALRVRNHVHLARKIDVNGYEVETGGQVNTASPTHAQNFYKFVTRPDIQAPRFNVTIHNASAIAPGYWFLAPYEEPFQDEPGGSWIGPAIYDGSGELVWSGAPHFQGWNAFDFKPTIVEGRAMISVIWRHEAAVVLDDAYREWKRMGVKEEGAELNPHEFRVLEDGRTALMMKTVEKEGFERLGLEMGGGYEGMCKVRHYVFEERDVYTEEIVFRWSTEGHIGLEETASRRENATASCNGDYGWDYAHLNSIDKFPDGDYLINSRTCNAMYKISHKDGSVVWRFGGLKSDFNFRDKFQGQHDARVRSQNETHIVISFLDNSYLPFADPEYLRESSRGLVVALRTDVKPMAATTLETYEHPYGDYALGRGSYQVLPNGNTFIGWTASALHTEYTPDGRLVLEAQLKAELRTYRSYKAPWIGRPQRPPDLYAEAKRIDGGKALCTEIWISWNGATEVRGWRFYRTTADGRLKREIGSVRSPGFESMLRLEGVMGRVYAEAVDANGAVLGRSEVFETILPAGYASFLDVVDNEQVTQDDDQKMETTPMSHAEWTSRSVGIASFVLGFVVSLLLSWAGWFAVPHWRRWRDSAYERLPVDPVDDIREETTLISKVKMQPSS